MKKIALCACFAAVSLLAGCVKDMPSPQPGGDADKVVGLNVPASFDWKTTKSVDCNFSAAHPSRVFVATERDAEPFASFVAGGGADAVALDVPAALRTLYVSYETETGVSRPEAVSVANSAAVYSLGANGKLYDGLEDGDKNTTKGNVIHMPSDGWGTLLFEDLWPAYGDYDFNDFVVNYKVQLHMEGRKNKVVAMHIGVQVKAVGGSLPYDLCLQLKGVEGDDIDDIESNLSDFKNTDNAKLVLLNEDEDEDEPAVFRFENIRNNPIRVPGSTYINTEKGYEMSDGQFIEASFIVYFDDEISAKKLAFDQFDFFVTRNRQSDGRLIEIHMGGFEPTRGAMSDYKALKAECSNTDKADGYYYSNDRLVWAINVPHDIRHAYEKVDFLKAYPDMARWAESGGRLAQDWYMHGVDEYLVKGK